MRNFKKEIIAILSGIAFAYAWQLFGLFLCSLSEPVQKDMFIPMIGIQIALAPMIAWIMFGLLKVSWFKTWRIITGRGLAFLVPFMFIAVLTVSVAPNLWHEKLYWVGNVVLSILVAFTVFRPLLYLKDSK